MQDTTALDEAAAMAEQRLNDRYRAAPVGSPSPADQSASPQSTREPWQMTRGEWVGGGTVGRIRFGDVDREVVESPQFDTPEEAKAWAASRGIVNPQIQSSGKRGGPKLYKASGSTSVHRDAVEAAHAANKPVPPEVLAEYGLKPNPPAKPDSSTQPWQMTSTQLLANEDPGVRSNSTTPDDRPVPPVGTLAMDKYGKWVMRLEMVDPRELVLTEDAEDGRRAPEYPKYVQWAKEGKRSPVYVSRSQSDAMRGKLVSSNRRRVLAAIDAGVDKIPAWVDVPGDSGIAMKHEDWVRQAHAAGKPVPPEVLAEYGLRPNPPAKPDSSTQPQGKAAAPTNKERTNGEEAQAPQAQVLNTGTAAPAPAQGTGGVSAEFNVHNGFQFDRFGIPRNAYATSTPGEPATPVAFTSNLQATRTHRKLAAPLRESSEVVQGPDGKWWIAGKGGRVEPQPAPAKVEGKKGVQAVADDIPNDVAERAFSGTSHVPETRARAWKTYYVNDFNNLAEKFRKLADTDELRAAVEEELTRFREGLQAKYLAYLGAHSRVMSSMITGPARFPVEANRKRMESADKRLAEIVEFVKRADKSITKRLFPQASGVIRSDDANAPDALRAAIEARQRRQEAMKEANKIVRKGGDKAAMVTALEGLGFSNEEARHVIYPKFQRGMGFPGYALNNNNKEIRRLQERLATLEAQRAREPRTATFPGGKVVENAEMQRVQILYDDKPDEATREKLSSRGFRWAPSQRANQRLMNESAWRAALQITGATEDQKAPAQTENTDAIDTAEVAAEVERRKQADAATIPQEQTDGTGGSSAVDRTVEAARKQYDAFKQKHPNATLLMRIGDAYRAFDADADDIHKTLGLSLTTQENGGRSVGIPKDQLEQYIKKIVATGRRVAVAEVTNDSGAGVERGVTRVENPTASGMVNRSTGLRGKLAEKIAKLTRPALWVDHQLIREDGKYEYEEMIDKWRKVQDLSGAGFTKNLQDVMDLDKGRGEWWDVNPAAEELMGRLRKLRDDREAKAKAEREAQQRAKEEDDRKRNESREAIDEQIKSVKFTKGSVTITGGDGKSETYPASVSGGLTVHKREDGRFVVSHAGSGKAIDNFKTQAEARRFAARIMPLADWTASEASLLKATDEYTYRNLRAISSDIYAPVAVPPKRSGGGTGGASPGTPFRNTPTINDRAAAALMDWSSRARKRFDDYMGKVQRGELLGSGVPITPLIDLAAHVAFKALASGITSKSGRKLTAFIEGRMADIRAKWPDLNVTTATLRRQVRNMLAAANDDREKIIPAYAAARERVERQRTRATGKESGKPAEVREAVASATAERPDVAAKIIQAAKAAYRQGRAEGRREAEAAIPGLLGQIKRQKKQLLTLAGIERRGGKAEAEADQAVRDGIRKQVIQYAQTLPPRVRGKLVASIATATTPIKMTQTVRRLERELYRAIGRDSRSWFNKTLKPKKLLKSKGMTDKARNRLTAIRQESTNALGVLRSGDASLTAMRAAVATLATLQNEAGAILQTERAAYRQIEGERKFTAINIAQQATEDVKSAAKTKTTDDQEDYEANPAVRLSRSVMDIRNAVQMVTGKIGSQLESVLYKRFVKAENAMFEQQRELRAQVERACKAAGFKDAADASRVLSGRGGKGNTERVRATFGGKSVVITLGEALGLLGHASDPMTLALIHSEGGQPFQTIRGRLRSPVTPDPNDIDSLASQVDPDGKYRKFLEDIKAIMESTTDASWRVHYLLRGFEPVRVEKRWPRPRNMQANAETAVLPETASEMLNTFLENDGHFTHRVQTTGVPILLIDPITVVLDEISTATRTIHLAVPLRDAANVIYQPGLSRAIAARFGKSMFDSLRTHLMRMGRSSRVLGTPTARGMARINNWRAVSSLGLNPGTWAVTAISALRLLPMMGAQDFAAGIAGAKDVSMEDMMRKSGHAWERYEGSQASDRYSSVVGVDTESPTHGTDEMKAMLANIKAKDPGAAFANLQRIARMTMRVLNWFDGLVYRIAWAGLTARAKRLHPEWSTTQRERWVASKASAMIRESQQGSSPVDAAMGPERVKGTALSGITLFSSDALKSRNRIRRAYRKGKAAGTAALAAEVTSVVLGVVAKRAIWGLFSVSLAMMLGWDDEDEERLSKKYLAADRAGADAAAELANLVVPIIGQNIVRSIQNPWGAKFIDSPALSAIEQVAVQGYRAVKKSLDDDATAEEIGSAWARFVNGVTGATGVNPFEPWNNRVITEVDAANE